VSVGVGVGADVGVGVGVGADVGVGVGVGADVGGWVGSEGGVRVFKVPALNRHTHMHTPTLRHVHLRTLNREREDDEASLHSVHSAASAPDALGGTAHAKSGASVRTETICSCKCRPDDFRPDAYEEEKKHRTCACYYMCLS